MVILQLAAVIFAALFAGAALYITLVEQPARLALGDKSLLLQWQPSYKRALPIQSGLAIAAGLAGFGSWYLSGEWQWLAGSLAILANWPFTLLVIMPVNKRLMGMEPRDATGATRSMLLRWGKLHDIRSGLGAVSELLFIWGFFSS